MKTRKSNRLPGYDYSRNGMYFVTVCSRERECIFGTICDGKMMLNDCGKIVEKTWLDLPNHNHDISLDAFIVIPNHVHGIIRVGTGSKPVLHTKPDLDSKPFPKIRAGLEPAPTLSEIIRQFKTFSARRINRIRNTRGTPIWQRSFYDEIIREPETLVKIRNYIRKNPEKWTEDNDNIPEKNNRNDW